MSEHHSREDEIFAKALSMPVGERQKFIEAACAGDDELFGRIEALLRADDSVRRFMADHPSAPAGKLFGETHPKPALSEREGDLIGRYKLLQKLGEGGCGVVWMADQEEPVRRRVALKIIKLGMDTKEVIARFEAERQALAMLDHTNIARIYDAGATDTGRPFFVMELVRGIKITDFCDQYNLSTAQRLELFTQVCNAVQHAHQKGIIHRDLKPSNILVTLHDGVPIPKVIDFGIAKATEGRLTDRTLFTAFEQFIGTPAYMSPEQAELSGIDIDTRSDIYSLGVLLYELLTGRPPFDPKTLLQAGLDEIRRIIREVEPPSPSTNLSTLGAADRTQVARLRGTDPVKLSLLLRGDLDWIVMRCLEKNRTRRYETPNALAADIARHLHNEPVVARPPSAMYRFSRLVRRNRLAFSAVVAVSFALVVGMTISTWQAVRARRAERQADVERARAQDLLKFMLGDLYTQLDKVGRLDVLESVADKATAYFDSLTPGVSSDTTNFSKARAQRLLGGIRMYQARYAEAAVAFASAYERASELTALHPSDGDMLYERGQAEFGMGYVDLKRADLPASTDWFTRYSGTCQALVALDPSKPEWRQELADSQQNLAVVYEARGELGIALNDLTGAATTLDGMIASDPTNLQLRLAESRARARIGEIAERQGDFGEALRQYTKQAADIQSIAESDPKTARWRQFQAMALLYVTNIEEITGHEDVAGQSLDHAQKLLAELVALDAKNAQWKSAWLLARIYSVGLAERRGDHREASRTLETLLPQIQAVAASEPKDAMFSWLLFHAWNMKARVDFSMGSAEAAQAASRAVERGERLLLSDGGDAANVGECAGAYVIAGKIASASGDAKLAARDWHRSSEILAPLLKGTRDWRILYPKAQVAILLGRRDEARVLVEQLNLLGFVPIDPWPDLDRGGEAKTQEQQNNKDINK